MPRRIVVIQGHPDPSADRFCRSLAASYADAEKAGHTVERIDIAALDFPLLATRHAFEHEPVPPSLEPAAAAIRAADHILLIFPLWLGTMPALVKGFLEQVMRPGVAFRYRDKGMPEMLMKGKSARIVVTMGMPGFVYRLWFRAHGIKALERNVFRFVGMAPVRTTIVGMIESMGDAKRRRWLDRMARLGAKGD